MLGTVHSAAIFGFDAVPIKVEVDVASSGLPGWQMVGLPEKAVQEAKERVQAALRNSGIKLEARKTTINLAPADCKKTGGHYDLPIAIAILLAHGVIPTDHHKKFLFAGELSLTGELRPIQGALLIALTAWQKKLSGLVMPHTNQSEAEPIEGIEAIGFENLSEVIAFLQEPNRKKEPKKKKANLFVTTSGNDMSEVKGQNLTKRALEIAAAGGHHALMIGSPGSGKTMLAERFADLLPPLTFQQSLEVTKIYSASGSLSAHSPWVATPPFRAPHHTASYAALIGSFRSQFQVGETSLAHHGVLFLDELPEFRRDVLEALRQPLEAGKILVHRAQGRITCPAKFQMLAAMNPCKCGWLGHPKRACVCDPGNVLRYRRKISGPLLDRIDIQVEVPPVHEDDLFQQSSRPETSATIQQRVMAARDRQLRRYQKLAFFYNARLSPKYIDSFCPLQGPEQLFIQQVIQNFSLSARSYHRILKVARTIADLAGQEKIQTEHLAEAVQYRSLDRNPF